MKTEPRVVSRFRELLAIKSRREGRTISQREASVRTGLPKATVDRYARNEVSRFDESTVLALCNYFDCQVGDLLVIEEVAVFDDPETESPLDELAIA